MFKFIKSLFSQKPVVGTRFDSVRMKAFIAVHANPVRATGCYGWKLRMAAKNV